MSLIVARSFAASWLNNAIEGAARFAVVREDTRGLPRPLVSRNRRPIQKAAWFAAPA